MRIPVCVGTKVSGGNERFPFTDKHQPRALKNHYQTLERLNERGGLVWSEALAIIEDRDWKKEDAAEAERKVREYFAPKADGAGQ